MDLLFTAFLSWLYVALRLLLNVQSETSIAEILLPPACWDLGPGALCRLSLWCHQSAVVGILKRDIVGDFFQPVKPSAQRKQSGRCWCNSLHGFHCVSLVASVTSKCLLHSSGASKRRTDPGHKMYCFLPWWQCPAQVHRALTVPWVLLAYHL